MTMTTYDFVLSTSSIADFLPSASITINGTFADLPTLSSTASLTYDFGALSAFSLTWPTSSGYSLADFTCPKFVGTCSIFGDYPRWNISPSGISFINKDDSQDFGINFASSATLYANQDNGLCFMTGLCSASGHWVEDPPALVSEPSTSYLILASLLLAFCSNRRQRV